MSVNAKDLRIGNIINNYYKGYEVVSIGLLNHLEQFNPDTHQQIYQPIPLTEDILLKCGFDNTKQSNKNYFKHPKISGGIFLGSNYSIYKYTNIIIELNWLHKLQNLYFALTGEELTVNI